MAAFSEQREGGHADEIETSIMLYLDAASVDLSRAVADYVARPPRDYPGYRPGAFSREEGHADYSATGQHGDATLATAEKGRRTLEIMTREWLRALRGFAAD